MKPFILILLSTLSISCDSQEKISNTLKASNGSQIAQYVTSAFQDSKGNLWFGTIAKGIARYNGNTLRYFTTEDGLPSDRVISVCEDQVGVLWFATGHGISSLKDEKFTNYVVKEDHPLSNMVSQVFIDQNGEFWIGTWNGVYTFDGQSFSAFAIPYPEVDTPINPDTQNWITEINQAPNGKLWFARDGYGACAFDGTSFSHVLKKDGLHSNNITDIEFDQDGSIWFASRVAEKDNPEPAKKSGAGGVNKWTPNNIISFPEIEAFNRDDVYQIYKDNSNYIWISTVKNGVYKYDGKSFRHYAVPISIMGMTNDKKGNLWLAGAGGLYKINKHDELENVSTLGPWD